MRPNSFLFYVIFFIGSTSSAFAAQECVILLHALARTTHSMTPMATYLRQSNYIVINQEYPTTKKSIKTLADEDLSAMVNQCERYKPSKINFVTHSIGGLVLRMYLQNHHLANVGRIVMLAPPNHGSPLADLLRNNWLFKTIVGPAGEQLTTHYTDTSLQLNHPIKYPIGIIAGNFSFNPFGKIIFHEDNDGKVAVSSTRIPGMSDFIVLPVSHMFMPQNPSVLREVSYFLKNGKFDNPAVTS